MKKKKEQELMKKIFFLFIFFFSFNKSQKESKAFNIEIGEKLFELNCNVCHPGRQNLILPEKNLKKENLKANGMDSIESIRYQVKNGKNGMPAFGDRLNKNELEEIANYLL
jgi:cytochrome c6